jgi:hypothetical protein
MSLWLHARYSSKNHLSQFVVTPQERLSLCKRRSHTVLTYWIYTRVSTVLAKLKHSVDVDIQCKKMERRARTSSTSQRFQFLTSMEGASAEELNEFLVRFMLFYGHAGSVAGSLLPNVLNFQQLLVPVPSQKRSTAALFNTSLSTI